jgi:hypothetical protein
MDMAFIGTINAGKHIHQGRFAASVFTQNGQNLTLIYIEVNMIISDDTAKSLGNAAHAESDFLLHGLPPNHNL